MAAALTALAVDSHEPAALARWWHAVLGGELTVDAEGEASLRLASPPLSVDFLRVPEAKAAKNRLHLDINPVGGNQDAELERLLSLGAVRVDVGQPADARWFVLSDPEGNEFCLLRTPVSP